MQRDLAQEGHAELVGAYFRLSHKFTQAQAYDLSPRPGQSDPLYAVLARRLTPQDGG